MPNKIELRLIRRTGSGSLHVQVLINGKDVGVLYLSETERDTLISLIHSGPFKGEVEFISDIDTEEDPEPYEDS